MITFEEFQSPGGELCCLHSYHRSTSAYLARQLETWGAATGGEWVDPDGGLGDDFDDMGVASWDGGAWNDDGA